jgi:hypothetical protein
MGLDSQVQRLMLIIALIAGGGVAVWFGALDYLAARSETSPTSLPIDAFNGYAGQRWLKIEQGVFVTDRVVIRDVPRREGDAEDQSVMYLPMAPRGWRPNDPVHVICKLGPGPRARAAGWLRENGGGALRTFTGVVVNEPAAPIFPALHLGEHAVMLQENGRLPDPGASIGIIALGVVMFLAGVAVGVWLVRDARTTATK